ncbi:phosphoribosylglycinamide formyltransferase [Hyphococcus luteus]|uniref:Phosphoribosylglycinamide formyltransferase n=1 Tax=Hyphococcus luteus TaxID=2058213 RepID=A0A2S7JYY1_9PROT|nr:phosphoribosylglycinamide formyltransferase [Marinicaulis flavus]PQA85467.1 phosphoribosylglycinamide formyltransferase [Marinicaulis flavus]
MAKARIAVLISGRGTNLQALIDACADPDYPGEIALVVSNKPKAQGLERAGDAGIKREVVNHKDFETREDFEAALNDALKTSKVDYVCLAGFMRVLTNGFASDWRGRLLNIHPSLLPSFEGLHVHERMIEAGVKIAGCTVHFVSAEVDNGPIIGQAAVPVLPGDDADSLAARILEQEHRLYPACLRLLIEGKARLTGGAVTYDKNVKGDGALIVPSVS